VTLCDAGPLVALVNDRDTHHARCVAVMNTLPRGGLVTTWACLAEAMYLLGRSGWRAQDALWAFVARGVLKVHASTGSEWERMRTLMRVYRDTPMDLADASLVAASETLNQRRVFTIDRHFHTYRYQQDQAFEVVP
jgi:uncharacterized protein